ncbi:GAF and ANTAR domain-containing protein [Streptomyces sp. NPDC050095]|uniref:GAF and ANTAR domain-containing protein n=1 Tax=unclassified Streptomyces TaxID=2593676 RepID=UPI00342643B9
MADPTRELRLAAALVECADVLRTDFDPVHYLRRLADACVDLVGARGAGVLLAHPDGASTVAHSAEQDDLVRELLHTERSASPAHESLETGKAVPPVGLDSAEAAARWPAFTAAARRRGIGATYAVPLRRRDDVVGALGVFLSELPWSDPGLAIAQTLADMAAVGLHNQRAYAQYRELTRQLQAALASRVRIEQAKGMLAERWETEPDAAFSTLRQYARSNQLQLDTVARAVLQRALTDVQLRPGKSGSA